MKPFLVFLFTLIFYFTTTAQVKPIYFIGDSTTTDKTKATAYGVSGKLSGDSLYMLKMYDLYDNLMQTGTYKDEKLTVPHGRFLYYSYVDDFNYDNETNFYLKDKDRFLSGQGDFVDGRKVGRWVKFFPDLKIFEITNYVLGLKHGEYKVFNRKGKITTAGNYKLDVKEGVWVYDYGKKEYYTDGLLTHTIQN